ncbi:MAG: pilus assembly protein TadG-related protein, partial [Litorimonas sp.]
MTLPFLRFSTAFSRNERGNFALMSAILLPLLLLGGLGALDYGSVVRIDQKLKADAEAAVLAAVNETHIAYIAEESGVNLRDLAEEHAREVFLARTNKTEADFESLTIDAQVRSNVFTVQIDYALKVPSLLKGMSEMDSWTVGNSARARASATSYININMIFDVSGSMGIGSSPADQQIVADATGCAFACHTRGHSSYQAAHDAGAVLRIDTARKAAINAIASVVDDLTLDEQVTVGIHKFSNVTTEVLAHDDPKSSDLAHVKSKLETEIELDTQFTGTNMTGAMEEVMAKLPDGGMGRTPDDRIQY